MTVKTPKPTASTVEFDYELYAHHLDGEDMSEEEKRECLEALWLILSEFVALGFKVHPVQQAQNACGKSAKNRRKATLAAPFCVSSKNSQSDKKEEDLNHEIV